MKLGVVLFALAALAWAPGQPASAQSEAEPQVSACLNSSALSAMRSAGARVDTAKARYPTTPEIGGHAYAAETDGVYAVAPGQLRYHAKLENGEPLFTLFGTALGAPGALFMLASTEVEGDGCGFIRFNLRDRWMTTYSVNGFWEVMDRASITYEDGTFKFEMLTFGGYRSPDADPREAYDFALMAFRCPDRLGLHLAANMTAEGEALWAGRYTDDDGQPDWRTARPADRILPLQRFFCGNGAGASTARHFPDQEAALAAWRAEHER